eukprot:TRINITY_DN9806_c0_g2_i2.p1 TRINITY_DN9806_c0_g2~~TRINITY_DN9806_c0_g2_i2.p1  ORF type:complete len:540 (+),score=154.83 TRINITY_DN9806_c0_g2_i2:362-1981(+)
MQVYPTHRDYKADSQQPEAAISVAPQNEIQIKEETMSACELLDEDASSDTPVIKICQEEQMERTLSQQSPGGEATLHAIPYQLVPLRTLSELFVGNSKESPITELLPLESAPRPQPSVDLQTDSHAVLHTSPATESYHRQENGSLRSDVEKDKPQADPARDEADAFESLFDLAQDQQGLLLEAREKMKVVRKTLEAIKTHLQGISLDQVPILREFLNALTPVLEVQNSSQQAVELALSASQSLQVATTNCAYLSQSRTGILQSLEFLPAEIEEYVQGCLKEQDAIIQSYQEIIRRNNEHIHALTQELIIGNENVTLRNHSGHGVGDANHVRAVYAEDDGMEDLGDEGLEQLIEMVLNAELARPGQKKTSPSRRDRRQQILHSYVRQKVSQIVQSVLLRTPHQRRLYLAERDALVKQARAAESEARDELQAFKSSVQANLTEKVQQLQQLYQAFHETKRVYSQREHLLQEQIQQLRSQVNRLETDIEYHTLSTAQYMTADQRKMHALIYERDKQLAEKDATIKNIERLLDTLVAKGSTSS